MSDSTIRWEQDADGVVVLTLDDPSSSANTMNDAYVRSMGETVDRLEAEKNSIRGVVLTSAKKTFFAGGNLGSLIRATPETRDQVLAQVTLVKAQLRRLETLGIPVASAINGAALGGGLEIALATHHRVVLDDPKVKLGFPEVALGLLPGGGGIVRSVRLLGLTTALLELLLQGQQIRPSKAMELGLVHELAADRDELLAKAKQWVLSSDTALARAYDVVRQIGKTPIVVQDSRGFFTSRVFGTLVLEGAALLAEGLAPMSIERAALQAGFPAGPLTLLDEVTLTLPLKISDEAKKAGSVEDHPGLAVLRRLVEHG